MRYLFFASVWLHDYFILCQNRIFGINDPKTCPRLNTAEVTFVAYHCKDLKGVIWVGLLVVPKKISCLAPIFCIVIRNKEHNNKYFGIYVNWFSYPHLPILKFQVPPSPTVSLQQHRFSSSPYVRQKSSFILIDSRRGGERGVGVGISPFLFCTHLHMPRLCWFLFSCRNKAHTFIWSISQYLCIHDHSFIHSLLHSCIILSWIMKNAFVKFTSFLAWVLTCFTCSSSSSS